jgi:hypothetical protein
MKWSPGVPAMPYRRLGQTGSYAAPGRARTRKTEITAGHGIQVGTLIKSNQKTATVLTDDGRRRWKVSPQMLSPVIEETGDKTNAIELRKQK